MNLTYMNPKKATTDHPINSLLTERWSPYAFDARPVSEADLQSLFEAARWAASSNNEQPWSFIMATSDNSEEFSKLLSCLVEPNQAWAKAAPVLVLNVTTLKYSSNNKDNRAAVHDLGLCVGNLLVEATVRGLSVHQMIGILPDKARELYQIPAHSEAWTAMAIGYQGDPSELPDSLKQRDLSPRRRKPLSQFVFTGKWSQPSRIAL
jgi:nitroreductase